MHASSGAETPWYLMLYLQYQEKEEGMVWADGGKDKAMKGCQIQDQQL